jgi:hypothetical protein
MSPQKDLTEHLCDQQQRAEQLCALLQLMIAAKHGDGISPGREMAALSVAEEIATALMENLDCSVWQRLPGRDDLEARQ